MIIEDSFSKKKLYIYEGGRKSSRPPVYIAIVCESFPVIYDY